MTHPMFTLFAQEYPFLCVALICLCAITAFCMELLEGEPRVQFACGPWAGWIWGWITKKFGGAV